MFINPPHFVYLFPRSEENDPLFQFLASLNRQRYLGVCMLGEVENTETEASENNCLEEYTSCEPVPTKTLDAASFDLPTAYVGFLLLLVLLFCSLESSFWYVLTFFFSFSIPTLHNYQNSFVIGRMTFKLNRTRITKKM